jgi:FolB domain-containing protein
MEDRVFIKNLLIRGIIGINDWERKEAQDILINVEILCDIRDAANNDDVTKSVNYRTVAKKIIEHASQAAPLTVERLAEDIAKLCLEEKPAQSVSVRVEKPGAVRFADSVGVEISRKN